MSRARAKDFTFDKKSVTGYELAWNTEQNFGVVNLTLDDNERVHLRVNSLAIVHQDKTLQACAEIEPAKAFCF